MGQQERRVRTHISGYAMKCVSPEGAPRIVKEVVRMAGRKQGWRPGKSLRTGATVDGTDLVVTLDWLLTGEYVVNIGAESEVHFCPTPDPILN